MTFEEKYNKVHSYFRENRPGVAVWMTSNDHIFESLTRGGLLHFIILVRKMGTCLRETKDSWQSTVIKNHSKSYYRGKQCHVIVLWSALQEHNVTRIYFYKLYFNRFCFRIILRWLSVWKLAFPYKSCYWFNRNATYELTYYNRVFSQIDKGRLIHVLLMATD